MKIPLGMVGRTSYIDFILVDTENSNQMPWWLFFVHTNLHKICMTILKKKDKKRFQELSWLYCNFFKGARFDERIHRSPGWGSLGWWSPGWGTETSTKRSSKIGSFDRHHRLPCWTTICKLLLFFSCFTVQFFPVLLNFIQTFTNSTSTEIFFGFWKIDITNFFRKKKPNF